MLTLGTNCQGHVMGEAPLGGAGGSEDEWLEFTYTTLLTPALTHIHNHVHIFIGIITPGPFFDKVLRIERIQF